MDATTTSKLDLPLTVSKPILEENDVSRQVVKPIYVATQINDSQTQRTEQTFEFGTVVKTEHTASAYIEDLLVLPIPTSLEPFEALTCYNTFLKFHNMDLLKTDQTIGSFMKYLKEKNSQNQQDSLSTNNSMKPIYIFFVMIIFSQIIYHLISSLSPNITILLLELLQI